MKIDMRLSATILIKSDEIDDGIFLYIFIATLIRVVGFSLTSPENRLVMMPTLCKERREGRWSTSSVWLSLLLFAIW